MDAYKLAQEKVERGELAPMCRYIQRLVADYDPGWQVAEHFPAFVKSFKAYVASFPSDVIPSASFHSLDDRAGLEELDGHLAAIRRGLANTIKDAVEAQWVLRWENLRRDTDVFARVIHFLRCYRVAQHPNPQHIKHDKAQFAVASVNAARALGASLATITADLA